VRRDEDGPLPVGEREDQLTYLIDADRVESVGGLVEHEQLRFSEEGGCDAQPLLHPERVLTEPVAASGLQADQTKHFADAAGIVPAEGRQGAEVLDAAQARPEGGRLDHRPDAAEIGSGFVEAFAEDRPAASRRCDETKQHRHCRGFAGAIRADEPGDSTRGNLELKRVDGQPAAVALG
jgi:hypothetical protein